MWHVLGSTFRSITLCGSTLVGIVDWPSNLALSFRYTTLRGSTVVGTTLRGSTVVGIVYRYTTLRGSTVVGIVYPPSNPRDAMICNAGLDTPVTTLLPNFKIKSPYASTRPGKPQIIIIH